MVFYGLRTAIYHVRDLDRAKEWYGTVLGIRPYFEEPFYVGFDIGGFELGL
jgi:catechol 2,3-dioxygenase-like lactoylglutathione lyase family enzyme